MGDGLWAGKGVHDETLLDLPLTLGGERETHTVLGLTGLQRCHQPQGQGVHSDGPARPGQARPARQTNTVPSLLRPGSDFGTGFQHAVEVSAPLFFLPPTLAPQLVPNTSATGGLHTHVCDRVVRGPEGTPLPVRPCVRTKTVDL